MDPQPHGFEDLQCRVVKLEKQNRRLKQLGAAALTIPVFLLIMGQTPSRKTVEANEFILRDDSGNVRVRLAINPARSGGAPEMFFFDEKGKPRLELDGGPGRSTDGGGTFSVYDGQGLPRGLFAATVSTGALVSIFDPDKAHPRLGQAVLGPGRVSVSDDKGFSASFGSEELVAPQTGETRTTSAASVVLFDKNKNVLWKAP